MKKLTKPLTRIKQINQIRFFCAILALFCFITMYVPVIAPRYPAADYFAPEGDSNYFYTGDYYLAKSYWSQTDFVFANHGIIGRVLLSLDQAILLIWAYISVSGKAERKKNLMVAGGNLVVNVVIITLMLRMSWAVQWGVLVVMLLIMIVSVVVAWSLPSETSAVNEKPQASKLSKEP